MSAVASWIVIVSHAAAANIHSPATAAAEIVAPGVALLRGAILPGRGPDGNTIVFDAPEGLVVVDTGRHDWHSDAILALARERGRPIVAILNTHWHLDHSSGNGRIKAAYPGRAGLHDECRRPGAGRGWIPRPESRIRAGDAG